MSAHSLTEVVKLKGAVRSLLLRASKDLVCSNLWCEKVTGPCVCRLERTLQKIDVSTLVHLDLSGNRLTELPPAVRGLTALQSIDLSDNDFGAVPDELQELSSLQSCILEGNPCDAAPAPESESGDK